MKRAIENDVDESTEETTEKRQRTPFLIAVRNVTVITLGLALLVTGFYLWRVIATLNDINRQKMASDYQGRPAAHTGGGTNYVLMGSDSRGAGDRGRSDVLMLAHVPPSKDKVYLISFPRDMWVNVPGHGMAKINAAYAWGGEQLTVRTLEELIQVRADHTVKTDFEGFVSLTNELGGVEVYNRVASSAAGYTYPKGYITLKGEQALVYVRQRYELPNGDLDRAERQRAMTTAILMKMVSLDVVGNPIEFNKVMSRFGRHFTVDEELTNAKIFETAASMKVRYVDDVRSLQAPISGFGRSADGQSIDIVNEAQLAELSKALRENGIEEYYNKYKDQPFSGRKK